jgi:TonB family protein
MFDVLVASGAHLELRPRWLTTSLVTHGLAISLAVVATRTALDAPKPPADTAMLLYVPKPPPPSAPEARPAAPAARAIVAAPPPKGFQTVVALQDIPKVIPPVNLSQEALDPRDFTGRGVEGGVAAGVVGGTGKVETAGELERIYEATTSDARFEQATLVSEPTPRYPAALEAVRIEGRVALEFVIDTTGRVAPSSIKVLESTHPAFEAAARDAVARATFRPARLSGHPVRQLTRQAIKFVAAS